MTKLTIQQVFQRAVRHHQNGQLPEAEYIYRQILAQQPDNAEATHNLGLIAQQVGRTDTAQNLLRRAISLRPTYAEAYFNLGNILKDQKKFDEAVAAYRQAITLRPNYAEVHNNLGNILNALGQHDLAIAAYREAISLRPAYAQGHYNLGVVLIEKKQFDEAINCFQQAIALRPDYADAHNNLGIAFSRKKQFDEAIAAFRKTIALQPQFPDAQYNLGNALKDNGSLDEAIASYRRAIFLKPDSFQAVGNLANALKDKGELEEALALCRQAIALKPKCADTRLNLGRLLIDSGQLEQAIALYKKEIALDPNYAEAHWNFALSLLLTGDLQQGWQEYEWRWKRKDFKSPLRGDSHSLWDGSPLNGRTILLEAEQGFGDVLQMIRYLPQVEAIGGKIIVECQPDLKRLFQTTYPHHQFVHCNEPLPPFDLHTPLLSLPRIFGTTLDNLPNNIPYIRADPDEIEKWRQRIAEHSQSLKVGLVWAGSPGHKNDGNRSMPLALLAPLWQITGIRFFSLQKGTAATQANPPPAGMEIIDWTNDLTDFADTAALIANLDLVIAVDTAIVHLAGAMGKPVWTMLPVAPDWRWLRDRDDNPWYPTMRLFRQKSWGDWPGVIARIADELSRWNSH